MRRSKHLGGLAGCQHSPERQQGHTIAADQLMSGLLEDQSKGLRQFNALITS